MITLTVLAIVGAIITVFGVVFGILALLLGGVFWFLVRLPLAIIMFVMGIVFCCTLILIPLGILCFRGALRLLF